MNLKRIRGCGRKKNISDYDGLYYVKIGFLVSSINSAIHKMIKEFEKLIYDNLRIFFTISIHYMVTSCRVGLVQSHSAISWVKSYLKSKKNPCIFKNQSATIFKYFSALIVFSICYILQKKSLIIGCGKTSSY